MMRLSVATYNIHKGVSQLRRRPRLHTMRNHLRGLDADIVFLQEVRGAGRNTRKRVVLPEGLPQYAFLADCHWFFAYGRNADTKHGHHGNALLSRYPILHQENTDISAHWLEQRGFLYCRLNVHPSLPRLHCLNVHLGLFEHWRRKQLATVIAYIHDIIPDDEPLLMAGDFNDWNKKGHAYLRRSLNVTDAFVTSRGVSARTFPSIFPLLPLDRIYVRGFQVCDTRVYGGPRASRMSDHAALTAEIELKNIKAH